MPSCILFDYSQDAARIVASFSNRDRPDFRTASIADAYRAVIAITSASRLHGLTGSHRRRPPHAVLAAVWRGCEWQSHPLSYRTSRRRSAARRVLTLEPVACRHRRPYRLPVEQTLPSPDLFPAPPPKARRSRLSGQGSGKGKICRSLSLGEIARSYNVEPLDDFEAFTVKLAEIMYAWTPATWELSPTAGKVRVGVHPDRVG